MEPWRNGKQLWPGKNIRGQHADSTAVLASTLATSSCCTWPISYPPPPWLLLAAYRHHQRYGYQWQCSKFVSTYGLTGLGGCRCFEVFPGVHISDSFARGLYIFVPAVYSQFCFGTEEATATARLVRKQLSSSAPVSLQKCRSPRRTCPS